MKPRFTPLAILALIAVAALLTAAVVPSSFVFPTRQAVQTLTGSRALVSNSSGLLTNSTVTSTELGYVSGVTSAIQTQLDAKATAANLTTVSNTVTTQGNTLATNTALLNGTNTFTGTNNFTGAVIITNAGSTISGDGSGLTNLAAGSIASGSLADARLSTNVPLLNAANTFTGNINWGGGSQLKSTGLLGIGTNAPLSPLDILSNNQDGFRIRRTASTSGSYELYIASDGGLKLYDNLGGGVRGGTYKNGNYFYGTSGSAGTFVSIQSATNSNVILGLYQPASQAADSFRIVDNSSRTIFNIDANGVIVLPTNTSAPATITGSGQIYSLQTAGTAEIFVKDGAGNATQISPHARGSLPPDGKGIDDGKHPFPIIVHHQNVYAGEEEWVNLTALAAAVEKLTGQKIAYKRKLADGLKADWEADQDRQQAAHFAERQRELDALSKWQASTSESKGTAPTVRGPFVRMPKPDHVK